MAAPVDTIGGGEGSVDSQSSLLGCLQNEFSDQVAREIYTKLTDEDIDDLQTLILTDDKDLDDLCKEMKLKGGKKIKFKAMIRKQKAIYAQQQPQKRNVITISTTEQTQFAKIEQVLKQTDDMQHLYESYVNQVEQHCVNMKNQMHNKVESIITAIQTHERLLITQVVSYIFVSVVRG